MGNTEAGAVYQKALVNGRVVEPGMYVRVGVEGGEEGRVVVVEYLYESEEGEKMLHGRVMERGSATVLGNAADPHELFLTGECEDHALMHVRYGHCIRGWRPFPLLGGGMLRFCNALDQLSAFLISG